MHLKGINHHNAPISFQSSRQDLSLAVYIMKEPWMLFLNKTDNVLYADYTLAW